LRLILIIRPNDRVEKIWIIIPFYVILKKPIKLPVRLLVFSESYHNVENGAVNNQLTDVRRSVCVCVCVLGLRPGLIGANCSEVTRINLNPRVGCTLTWPPLETGSTYRKNTTYNNRFWLLLSYSPCARCPCKTRCHGIN
jgi:hypothetical protein